MSYVLGRLCRLFGKLLNESDPWVCANSSTKIKMPLVAFLTSAVMFFYLFDLSSKYLESIDLSNDILTQ